MSVDISQINYENIKTDAAMELLAVAPFNVKVPNKPIIYWICPHGMAKGYPIIYKLVKDFNVVEIESVIENYENDKITVRSVDTRCGNWTCEHSVFPNDSNLTTVFCDKIHIKDFSEVFFNEVSVMYFFEERKEMKRIMAETRKMQALSEHAVS